MIIPSHLPALLLFVSTFQVLSAETLTLYNHGDPTPDEQYMLELINRARANPAAEGGFLAATGDDAVKNALSYFKVDLNQMREDFASYSVQPPLAFSPLLMRSARAHSDDMATRNFQSHDSSDGTTFDTRIATTGYLYSGIAENVYSLQVKDALYAHAGFNIDWGDGPGGMQTGVGHRKNIMNYEGTVFKEIGIGVIARSGRNADANGDLCVTQDFGLSRGGEAYLLGVVYADANANGICDPGEGLAGVTVSPSPGSHYAVTSTSGGYAIPFDSPTDGVLTFSGGGLGVDQSRSFSIGGENVKIDLDTASVRPIAVRLEVVNNVARETRGSAKLRILRDGPDSEPLTVIIRRSKGNSRGSAAFSDYKLKGASIRGANGNSRNFRVTIPAGKSSVTIRLKAVNDREEESKEKVTFKIKPTNRYEVEKQAPAKIFITR